MEPFCNRLCGRSNSPIHSISNSIPDTLDQVKNGYDYIIRGTIIKEENEKITYTVVNVTAEIKEFGMEDNRI